MTVAMLVVTVVCGAGAGALAVVGAYWLGGRDALRAHARDVLDHELAVILADDADDGEGGIRVEATR